MVTLSHPQSVFEGWFRGRFIDKGVHRRAFDCKRFRPYRTIAFRVVDDMWLPGGKTGNVITGCHAGRLRQPIKLQ